MFVAGTLVPLMVTVPTYQVLEPSVTATGLPPGGGVVELLDDLVSQPAMKRVAAKTPMIIAFFIKLGIVFSCSLFRTRSGYHPECEVNHKTNRQQEKRH